MQIALVLLLLGSVGDGALQGTVRDAGTGEPVALAEVFLDGDLRAHTDSRGYFMLPGLESGDHDLRVEAVGYQGLERPIRLDSAAVLSLRLELEPSPFVLPGLEVATARRGAGAAIGPSPVVLDRIDIDVLPALGEPDVFRTIQTLPAVQAASDFSSALYTRGGSPDQTMILLDGAPLFNPFHLGGVFAAIDPDAVATIEVVPGAMEAHEPDRLSGVVKVQTREGSRDQLHGRGGIGLVSSRVSLDGPLFGGRGGWLLAGRRTYLDVVSSAASAVGLIEDGLPYGFYDALGKLSLDTGELGRISAAVYLNRELLTPHSESSQDSQPEREDRFSWGSFAGSVRYTQPLGSRFVLEATAALSRFATDVEIWEAAEAESAVDTRAAFFQMLSKADLTWYLTPQFVLRGGFKVDHFTSDYRIAGSSFSFQEVFTALDRESSQQTVAGYVDNTWKLSPGLQVRAGLRALAAEGLAPEFQPRVGFRWELGQGWALTGSAGRYAQPIYSIRNEESLGASYLAYDLIEPVPEKKGFETARELVAGAEWARSPFRVRLDAYAKRFDRLFMAPIPANPFGAPAITDTAITGAGSAYGIELLGRYDGDIWGGQIGYSWSRLRRRQPGLEYAPRFSRSHVLDVTAHRAIGETGRITLRAVGGTGQPYTPAVGSVHVFRQKPGSGALTSGYDNVILLGRHNSARLPGYLRVDLGVRKTFEKDWFGRQVTLTPYGQILNVLNTRNVVTFEPTPAGTSVAPNELRYPPQLPFLPTFGIEWRF